jgi:hypothetical protein
MKTFRLLPVIALIWCVPLFADEGHHHDEIDAKQLGTVHFPISCAPEAQKPFERGVALLHSFWYEEARKQFEQLAKDDRRCAMAHWGIAMSLWHQLWNEPDAATLKAGREQIKGAKSLHPKAGRERDYVAALEKFYVKGKHEHRARAEAYSKAMETIYQRYPDDREAAAFYALSLLASEPEKDKDFANRKKAGSVLERVFAEEPDHPGVAHYLIHSYDMPQLAKLGLPAARRYAKIAPAAPHALHMPSHIFARLGLWQDDIDSNLASIAATRKTAAMHMGGASHQFHAMDFLVYAYLQSGREAEVKRIIDEVKAMPRIKEEGMDFDGRAYSLTWFPATEVLELHHWSEAAALEPVADAKPAMRGITYWARAIGAARSNDLQAARKDLEELEAIKKSLQSDHNNYEAESINDSLQQARAWIAHAEGNDEEALKLLRALAEKDDESGTSGDHEMLADLLLETNHPDQALAEYESSLKISPHRFNLLYGAARGAEMAGQSEKANSYYAQLVNVCAGSNSDRPELSRAKALLAQK